MQNMQKNVNIQTKYASGNRKERQKIRECSVENSRKTQFFPEEVRK